MPLCNLKQHLSTGGIKGDLAIVAAAEGLVRVGQLEAQCFQCLFLLRSNLAILIFTVKHMAFVDVRSPLIQMQGPIQNVNVFAETLMELIHKFCGDLKKFFGRSVALQRSKLIDAFFGAGFLAGEQIFQTFLTLGLQSRADAVITIPINVLLDTFRVDMLAVGNFKTAVIVLWVISAVLSGAAIVSGQFQRPSLLSGVTQRAPCAG